LMSLETSFSEYRQTNPFADAVSAILGIVQQFMTQQMTERSDEQRNLYKALVKAYDEDKAILDTYRDSTILKRRREDDDQEGPFAGSNRGLSEEARIQQEEEADELYRDVNINQGMGLHIEGNKSIQRSDEQRNLYKALVEAYDADKDILDTYGESTILNRRREDDDQEGPSAGSDRGSKRRKKGGEHASASTPSEPTTRSVSRCTTGTQSRQMSASKFAFAEEPVEITCQMDEPSHLPRKPPTPDRDWNKTLPAVQGSAQSWISELAKQADARSSFNELLDTPLDFFNFIMN
nr:hypothetical protein [Tanacetum cinerariifolium]